MPFPVGIPAGVAVRLVVDTVALTVPDALFQTAAGAGLTLPGTGIDRRSVTGNSQVIQVDKPLVDGNIQKLGFENLKQACGWVELFCLGGWTGLEMLSLSESHRGSKKS